MRPGIASSVRPGGITRYVDGVCEFVVVDSFPLLAYHRVVTISQVVAREMGGRYFSNVDDFCEQHPDVVLLATSILSCQDIVKGLPVQRLRRSTLFVDVRDQVLVGSVTRCCCCSLLLLLAVAVAR